VLCRGPAKKVTIHVNEDTSSAGDFLSTEIMSLLFREGVAGATLFRPAAGFGSHHQIHSYEDGRDSAQHMPVRIEFVETAQKVEALTPALCELLTDGLIEIQDTVILKTASASGTAQ
jgi:PII-like signaling protein